MMEFEYSPIRHHSPVDHLAILSPTHARSALDGIASIRQLRRSLSRSPSKPSRLFSLDRSSNSGSNPNSPSLLSYSACNDFAADTPVRRTSLKRTIPVRTSTRKISPNSPLRRALSDNTNQASPTITRPTRRSSSENDQENMDCDDTVVKQDGTNFNEPIKFELSKPRHDQLLHPVFTEHATPKGSPLKRSTGLLNLEATVSVSPRAKRRSVHGAYDQDFNVFEEQSSAEVTAPPPYLFTMPQSPHRKGLNLRKSTLQQRATPVRMRQQDGDRFFSSALNRARSRISFDGAMPLRNPDAESPVRRRSEEAAPVVLPHPIHQRLFQSAPKQLPPSAKPHPLSNILSPSSSSSSMTEEAQSSAVQDASEHARRLPSAFSKSLPLGAMRPAEQVDDDDDSQGSFATPAGYKMAKPLPQAFMSTGLISKRNRNIDLSCNNNGPMPDTPSKPIHSHVLPNPPTNANFGKLPFQLSGHDSPSTLFGARASDESPQAYRSSNIFGTRAPELTRRGSFTSINEDDHSQSPPQILESQSSADELPPTPTKSANSGPRPQSKGKSNSLRSSLFGRRSSLGPDTFVDPSAEGPNGVAIPNESAGSFSRTRTASPSTPSDHFTPPDASKLSISAEQRSSLLFPSNSYPPATPTGPRDQPLNTTLSQSLAVSGYFANDVDTSITSRFSKVSAVGVGEFSQVYKVEGPLRTGTPGGAHAVWAVKKSRKPYNGHKDRQRKMQEVQTLQQLRGHEHVIEYADHWEHKGHLYIQTQFCENGNLKDFLTQTGFKGRLEDFRIYKILGEMGEGIKAIHDAGFIHLDIKPANVFIDWEGVLKIGDFGLASTWPAPRDIDGEGDREYIAPEVLIGQFDRPSDIYSLGMLILEIAANIVLPDNGKSWQRLRAGDLSDLPSLTWSSDTNLVRNESGDLLELLNGASNDSLCMSTADDDLAFLRGTVPVGQQSAELVIPPNFMVDPHNPQSLDKVVQWMICPEPSRRPVVEELLNTAGVKWVQARRRAGATIYEGIWGPADEVLGNEQDVEMVDL